MKTNPKLVEKAYFLRTLGEQRLNRGESEASVKRELHERSSPRTQLALRPRLAFASVRLKYAKITPVLQGVFCRLTNPRPLGT